MRHPFKFCLSSVIVTLSLAQVTPQLVALRTCKVKDSLFKRKLTVKVHLVKSRETE